jgi:hypothetical protein
VAVFAEGQRVCERRAFNPQKNKGQTVNGLTLKLFGLVTAGYFDIPVEAGAGAGLSLAQAPRLRIATAIVMTVKNFNI